MRQFRRIDLRKKQQAVFAAAADAPVGITYQGKLRHVLFHGRHFDTFDRMPSFNADEFHRNAIAIFRKANKGPVAVIYRGNDVFVIVPEDYYKYQFFLAKSGDTDGQGTSSSGALPPDVK